MIWGILIFLLCCTAVGYAVLKTVRFLFPKKKNPALKNPYISYQEMKNKNDEFYDEYLEYMKRKGSGVLVGKVVSKEDAEAMAKIKKELFD